MINKAGLDLIKESEGLRLKAYLDTNGILTIGYGHTSDVFYKVEKGSVIVPEFAEKLLVHDLIEAELTLKAHYPDWEKLNANQYAALVSFVYNRGGLKLSAGKDTSLLLSLKAGNFEMAAKELDKWVYDQKKQKLPGLVTRRLKEKTLFLKEV